MVEWQQCPILEQLIFIFWEYNTYVILIEMELRTVINKSIRKYSNCHTENIV